MIKGQDVLRRDTVVVCYLLTSVMVVVVVDVMKHFDFVFSLKRLGLGKVHVSGALHGLEILW